MQISILGCGWLGLPLAKTMITRGHTVKGSTTTPDKVALLNNEGIDPYIIDLANYSPAIAADFIKGSEVLIINIPPKLRSGGTENYPAKINMIIPEIERSGIKKVLFVSSTSVYADENNVVTEETVAQPNTESGKQILQAEKVMQKNDNFKTTVLRFGGLIGAGRNPARFLAGKENLADPDGAVNLIQQEDCIGIILKIIEDTIWGDVFNGAAPQHPTREEYYTEKAVQLGLALPKFNHNEPSTGKTIAADKVINVLGYTFKKDI
jgi:nucleoside-diphosphate-sugar epimerase